MPDEVVQYIILRADPKTVRGKPPSAGKMIAMACHAPTAFMSSVALDLRALDAEGRRWLRGIFTKIVLKKSTAAFSWLQS